MIEQKQMKDVVSKPIQETEETETEPIETSEFIKRDREAKARLQRMNTEKKFQELRVKNENELQKRRLALADRKEAMLKKIEETTKQEEQNAITETENVLKYVEERKKILSQLDVFAKDLGETMQQTLTLLHNGHAKHVLYAFSIDRERGLLHFHISAYKEDYTIEPVKPVFPVKKTEETKTEDVTKQ